MTTSNLKSSITVFDSCNKDTIELHKQLNDAISTGNLTFSKKRIKVEGWDSIFTPIKNKSGEYKLKYCLTKSPSIHLCIYYNDQSWFTISSISDNEITLDCHRDSSKYLYDTIEECYEEHNKRILDINQKIDFIKEQVKLLEQKHNFDFKFTYSGIRQFYQVYFNSDKLMFGSSGIPFNGSPQFRPYEDNTELWNRVEEQLLLALREYNKFIL